jgi:hypothetical protein
MKINVAGVQVGRRADINVQTFRDFVVSIPTLGAPGLSNMVEDLTPQLGGDLDLNGSDIVASIASGPQILDLASSGSVATIRPNRGTVAGLGGSGGAIDIITGAGLSGLRVGTGPGQVNTVLQPLGTSGLLIGSVSGSFGLHNVASSATVPSLLNNFLSEVAGIGGISGACTMIAASLERITVNATGIGFFATTPAARPTGVAVTAAGIHAALVTLGLITA